MQSAFATRQFVTSFCTILSNPLCREVIDNADCTRMFQIGDRRMPIAYSRTKFVQRDLLCKAAVVEVAQTPTPAASRLSPLVKGDKVLVENARLLSPLPRATTYLTQRSRDEN